MSGQRGTGKLRHPPSPDNIFLKQQILTTAPFLHCIDAPLPLTCQQRLIILLRVSEHLFSTVNVNQSNFISYATQSYQIGQAFKKLGEATSIRLGILEFLSFPVSNTF